MGKEPAETGRAVRPPWISNLWCIGVGWKEGGEEASGLAA